MRSRAVAVIAGAVAVALVVFALTRGRMQDAAPPTDPPATVAAPAQVGEPEAETPTPALDDATIVAIFDAANTADIETGALAAERGASAEVRKFGAMLARDHEAVRKQGRDLAAKLGVTPTQPADDPAGRRHAEAMARLRALEGQDFDRAFLQHEVDFHRGVIDAVTSTLLPAIRNEELKALVVKVAPAFEAHMLAARQLGERLDGRR